MFILRFNIIPNSVSSEKLLCLMEKAAGKSSGIFVNSAPARDVTTVESLTCGQGLCN